MAGRTSHEGVGLMRQRPVHTWNGIVIAAGLTTMIVLGACRAVEWVLRAAGWW
jgi:hypothetical protein